MSLSIPKDSNPCTSSTLFRVPESSRESKEKVTTASGSQNGVKYTILSGSELKAVQERVKMYGRLHTETKDPVQKQFIRLQYKAEVCTEIESHLGTVIEEKSVLKKELKSRKRRLEETERKLEETEGRVGRRDREIRDTKKKLRRVEESLESKTKEVNELWQKHDDQEGTIKHLNRKLRESESKIARVEAECEEKVQRGVKRARNTWMAEMEAQRKREAELHKLELTNKEVEIQELRSKLRRKEKVFVDTRVSLEATIKRQRKTLEQIGSLINGVKTENGAHCLEK